MNTPGGGGYQAGGGGATHSSATVDEIRGWRRTEDAAWLDQSAVAHIKGKLASQDTSVWGEPVDVAVVGGETYVLDGHHRLTAAVEGDYPGGVPVRVIPEGEVQAKYGIDPADLPNHHFGSFGVG